MAHTYWHKQTPDKPLFPDLLWSRPQNKRQAGKLLIVGGNAHGFAAAAEAYREAAKAGIGTSRVLLPDSLQKTVGKVFELGEYAPSTPSGSFSQQAIAELLDLSAWSDATLLADDLGRNSETAVVLEKFLEKYGGPLAACGDSVDYFINMPGALLERPKTILCPTFAQLQKLASNARFATAFTSTMDFLHTVDALNEFTEKHQAAVVLNHNGTIFVSVDGQVSTTKTSDSKTNVALASHAATWYLQNPSNTFEALTASVL